MKFFSLIPILMICLVIAVTHKSSGQRAMGRATASDLMTASSRNALFRQDLEWTFGNKQQRGWYLYELLIRRTLNNSQEVQSLGFAKAVSMWQKKMALPSTGILDADSLYGMISLWQGARLKDRTPATPEQLLTAPVSDFYDQTRVEELRKVERETYAAYKRMIAAALADKSTGLQGANGELAANEKFLKIISSFRSREYQDELRRKSPNSGSAGLAVNSPHFTGRALDLYVGADPVDTRDSNRAVQVQTKAYQWLVRNAEKFGFRPYFYEPWHWEYVGK